MKRILLVGALLFSNIAFADCFAEGEKIIADGVLKQEIFPGPPNYESIADGDKPESVWIVDLDGEVTCATGAPAWGSRKKMQVITNVVNLTGFENKHVSIYGELVYAETGHHHTPLLVSVTSIEKFKQQESTAEYPKDNGQIRPGQITIETACKAYLGMVDQTYMYVSLDEEKYIVNAIELAGILRLSPKYIDYMVKKMRTNRHDFSSGQYIHNMYQSKEQQGIAVVGCMVDPSRMIPNWNNLLKSDLIATSN